MKLYLQTLNRHQVSQQEQADFYGSCSKTWTGWTA